MLIQDMSEEMSLHVLASTHIGHIACSKDLQPYVTPFSFGYQGGYIYSFATVGRKIEWMRANPLVCVEVAKIVNREDWQTVVLFGQYEELPDTPGLHEARVIAHTVMSRTAAWWEPGYAKTRIGESERLLEPVWFRILIHELSGHQGTPDNSIVRDKILTSRTWRAVRACMSFFVRR